MPRRKLRSSSEKHYLIEPMSRRETEISHEGHVAHEDENLFVLRMFRALRGENYLFSPGKIDI
jgi:hypothetical protein